MNKFARTVLFLGIIGLLALLVMKTVVENRVNSALKDAVGQINAFAYASYDEVDVNLWGSTVSISNIEINPYDEQLPPIRADLWRLEFTDNFFFKRLLGLNRNTLPDTATFAFEGLRLPLDTHSANAAIDKLNAQYQAIAEPGCGDIEFLSFRELADLGYHYPYAIDFTLHYDFIRWQQQLKVEMQGSMPDMGSVNIELEIANMPGSLERLPMAQRAFLSQLDISYHDKGYVKRINNYCAKQENLSLQDYIQQQTQRADAGFALYWGVVPNEEIRSLYSEFLQQPRSVSWRMSPGPSFNPNHLYLYELADWPKVLRLEMAVNGKPVDLNGFSQPQQPAGMTAKLSGQSTGAPVDPQSPDKAEHGSGTDSAPKLSYQSLPIDQLCNHVSKQVRIVEGNGKVQEGYLKSCEDGKARIAQRIHGGEFSVSIKLENIAIAEVKK